MEKMTMKSQINRETKSRLRDIEQGDLKTPGTDWVMS